MEKLPPTILVIFGITGDLSRRFLLPALSEICKSTDIGKDFKVLGVSRRQVGVDEVFGAGEKNLKDYSQMFTMNLSDGADYEKLKGRLEKLSQEFSQQPQVIFYLSVPPAAAEAIAGWLGKSGLSKSYTKLLLEKPFGYDLRSAQEMAAHIGKYFSQDQVYRIDHYLAKEMAQNITVFLGSNTIFRDIWNNQFIESVEIIASEKIGIEGRAHFYESTGALRDYQSHLLQLTALVLMEPCSDIFDFDEIPRRRLAALQAIAPISKDKCTEVVQRAQYEGYQAEVSNPGSAVETFVSLKFQSTDPRWQGVPVRLMTGKNLDRKLTEIRVNFKKTSASAANELAFKIQPDEGIELDLWAKEPGYERKLQKLKWSFDYDQHFPGRLPDAYEMVIVDAMRGNHSLFASSEEVLASWQILQPVLECWALNADDLKTYKPGSPIADIIGH
ncbi:glucose-6-phosphate dehydrogenase (NADP(+)) [Candidatus Saccharibacteria bacterium]|nr:glucose-6-phosphate dehydrogenase (NADP(+)) [Candidatus Saccharibacteria bacterium]